jgi:hypothetical protein
MSRIACLVLLLSSAMGCGGGYSTQEADARCKQERTNKPTLTDESFAQCVACFEDCGADCEAAGSTPEQYACPP